MTDDGLIAFVAWCRMNKPTIVFDPEVARRVYDAYDNDRDPRVRYPSVTNDPDPLNPPGPQGR